MKIMTKERAVAIMKKMVTAKKMRLPRKLKKQLKKHIWNK